MESSKEGAKVYSMQPVLTILSASSIALIAVLFSQFRYELFNTIKPHLVILALIVFLSMSVAGFWSSIITIRNDQTQKTDADELRSVILDLRRQINTLKPAASAKPSDPQRTVENWRYERIDLPPEQIGHVQDWLNDWSGRRITKSLRWDSSTSSAMRRFQEKYRLSPTGYYTRETRVVMRTLACHENKLKMCSSPY